MKIITTAGTRPDLIRLQLIIRRFSFMSSLIHKFVWTGQNFDPNLSDIFMDEFGLKPDITLPPTESYFLPEAIIELDRIFRAEKPDGVLVLGDVDSTLATVIAAEKQKIPVFHMEAGNRCGDRSVPEELNRTAIDQIATYNLPYTERSKQNLLDSDIPEHRIFKCGNPIAEVIWNQLYNPEQKKRISESYDMLLINRPQVFITFHRSETVDYPDRLYNIVNAINALVNENSDVDFFVSMHPRTKDRMNAYGVNLVTLPKNLHIMDPIGYTKCLEFIQRSELVITDSGTLQEEACILGTPSLTIRDTTERPETVDCGSNIVTGVDTWSIINHYNLLMKPHNGLFQRGEPWKVPEGYSDLNVSRKVIDFIVEKLR